MAMGVIEMARQRSVQVPRDLSVVGFDDIRFARHTYPPLTTIAQPVRQIGEGTVRLLLGILSGGDEMDTPASVTLRHTLVVRASTGPPPKNGAGRGFAGRTRETPSDPVNGGRPRSARRRRE
jgi:LacI family repressor for deo operon, udp, cdd, tsx, nupC, and nupG